MKKIFSSTVWSRLHWTNQDDSDFDIREVVFYEKEYYISPWREISVLSSSEWWIDKVSYDMVHFVKLLVKGNPTMMEVLFSPHKEIFDWNFFDAINRSKHIFLDSNAIYNSYLWYYKWVWNKVCKKEFKAKNHICSLISLENWIDLLKKWTIEFWKSEYTDYYKELRQREYTQQDKENLLYIKSTLLMKLEDVYMNSQKHNFDKNQVERFIMSFY
jgi:predicted nucleotidyltransferase